MGTIFKYRFLWFFQPDCCNKDDIHDSSEVGVVQFKTVDTQKIKDKENRVTFKENAGLECDGIPCANFYTTCCYSDVIHHFYCCNGENKEQLDQNRIDTDTKSDEETTEVANVGLECDGIPCASFYTTCCYSDLIHHFYCCNGEHNEKIEENIINLDTKSIAEVEKAKDTSDNKSIVKGKDSIDGTNAGLECDGIPCNPNIFHTCCYSDVIHHWYCC